MRFVPIAMMLLAACSPKKAADGAPTEASGTPAMANTAPPAAPSLPPGSAAAAYICPDKSEIFAMYVNDSTGKPIVALAIGSIRMRLPQVQSASGAKYADATASLWNKGNQVTFEHQGITKVCTTAESIAGPDGGKPSGVHTPIP